MLLQLCLPASPQPCTHCYCLHKVGWDLCTHLPSALPTVLVGALLLQVEEVQWAPWGLGGHTGPAVTYAGSSSGCRAAARQAGIVALPVAPTTPDAGCCYAAHSNTQHCADHCLLPHLSQWCPPAARGWLCHPACCPADPSRYRQPGVGGGGLTHQL